ncbi:hypothetical protein HXX76_011329 [Chlamydomonas incerta]|uniref:Ionotropic glutamate receptor C-terminal domain-containing protein n=1 Tax=Chlamydomonas incerta TaxID=51695 RepID=A0A835VXE9_CHLIN|nr:hypothetical protein HXX76_011329 [Chlamydomonas incerta]|eukprot:KAG2429089.1 hypothetical protein HXX76_011329 [Chlamydomonas incerta]
MGFKYTIRVMDWGAMATGLTLPPDDPAHCDIAPASIPVTTTDLANAVRFSVPTFRSGYAVAVGVLRQTSDAWGFTKVFNWQVWLALLISGMGISLLVWCAERDFTRRGMGKVKYPAAFRPGMYEATYRTYGKLLNTVDEPRVTSLPAKLMALGWGLVVLVTISTYTAGLTARLTAVNIQTRISGIADLPGHRVGTWDAIAKNFMKYGIRPEPLPWDTEADGLHMLDMVATGDLDALILDSPWLRYQLADRCDVKIVGRMFQYVNNAVGFGPGPSQRFIEDYNQVLAALIEEGMYETLELAYIRESKCGKVDPTTTVTFANLLGVYLIMVGCVGLGLLLMLLPRLSASCDPDIEGGTSPDDRDKSFIGRTLSRVSRAMSMSGGGAKAAAAAQQQQQAAGSARVSSGKVVPEGGSMTDDLDPPYDDDHGSFAASSHHTPYGGGGGGASGAWRVQFPAAPAATGPSSAGGMLPPGQAYPGSSAMRRPSALAMTNNGGGGGGSRHGGGVGPAAAADPSSQPPSNRVSVGQISTGFTAGMSKPSGSLSQSASHPQQPPLLSAAAAQQQHAAAAAVMPPPALPPPSPRVLIPAAAAKGPKSATPPSAAGSSRAAAAPPAPVAAAPSSGASWSDDVQDAAAD